MNPGFYISLFISHFGIIFPIVSTAFNLQIEEKWNYTASSFRATDLKSDFTLTPGDHNPVLNNAAQGFIEYMTKITIRLKLNKKK